MSHIFAVATKHGIAIDEHFGHAKIFYIYEVDDKQATLVDKRDVDHYCLGNHSSKTAMQGILEAIKDCHTVFIAKIGDGPTEKLEAIGVKATSKYAWEEIEPSLVQHYQTLQDTE